MRLTSLTLACGFLLAIYACSSSDSPNDPGGGEIRSQADVQQFFNAVMPELIDAFTELANRQLGAPSALTTKGGDFVESVPCPGGGTLDVNTVDGNANLNDCSAQGIVINGNLFLFVQPFGDGTYQASFSGPLNITGTFTGMVEVLNAIVQWSDPPTEETTYWEVTVMVGEFVFIVTSGGSVDDGECVERFGTAPGFMLCADLGDSCEFYALLNESTCDALCAGFGSTCVASYSDANDGCTAEQLQDCNDEAGDRICVCTK